eukprot:1777919-Prorocentrum_lima.AAC.1
MSAADADPKPSAPTRSSPAGHHLARRTWTHVEGHCEIDVLFYVLPDNQGRSMEWTALLESGNPLDV